jgi:hypothetical protein
MYDTHLKQSYATNADLAFVAGCGQPHNEAAWSARLPQTLRALLPAREEPAELTAREFPPSLTISQLRVDEKAAQFGYTALFGFNYALERAGDLGSWSTVSVAPAASLPWANNAVTDPAFPDSSKAFWRLTLTPAP